MTGREPTERFPYARPEFVFGGISSKEFGIILKDIRSFGKPERDVTMQEVIGRNGDLVLDNSRWKNMQVSYECLIISDFLERFQELCNAFLSMKGYQILSDSLMPDQYRMALLTGPIEPTVLRKGKSGTFELTFQCKPQRFFFDGQQTQNFPAPGKIYNAYPFPSKPLITIHGSGPSVLTVGSRNVEILAMNDSLVLDCETMNAYRQVGQGAPENQNGSIYAMEFPELTPGNTEIHWTGGITSVEIVPRWWTI